MLAQATTPRPDVASDPALERAALALAVTVIGLLLREVWQTYQSRKERRARDKAILSALLREISMISGIARAIASDINKEREMLATQQRWRLKPLLRFPTTIYELVRAHIPTVLLKQEGAVASLAILQTQCEYSNALADEHQKWKTPEARGQPDQIETILSFHESIMESANNVLDRVSGLQPVVVAAGEAVGGLNLAGPPPRPSRWARLTARLR